MHDWKAKAMVEKKNIGSFEISFLENNPFMQFDLSDLIYA